MLISNRSLAIGETVPRIDSDRWTVDVSTTHAEYPASKIQTDNLDDAARAWGQRRSQTRITSSFTSPSTTTIDIDYVAVLGLNRKAPAINLYSGLTLTPNQARLIVDTVPPEAHFPQIQSFAFALTNLTGTYDILNQVINAPEEALVGGYTPSALTKISNASNTVVDVSFENTYAVFRPFRSGAGLQEIQIHARDSVNVNAWVNLTVTLRQYVSSVWTTVGTLTLSEIEKTTYGYILIYRWNASSLPSDIEKIGLRITGATTGTSTPEYLSVLFRPAVSGTLYDSGWDTIDNPREVVWLPNISEPATALYTIVEFSDLNVLTNAIISGAPGGVPSYFYLAMPEALTIGRFLAGSALEIALRETGFNPRKVGNNQGALVSAHGGFLRAQRMDLTRWEVIFNCEPQPQTYLFGALSDLFEGIGFSLPALFIDDVTDPPKMFWAVINSWDATDLGPQKQQGEPHFELSIAILEVNAHSTRRSG